MKFPKEVIEADAKFWGLCYQGQSDPIKIEQFIKAAEFYDNGTKEWIWELSQKAATAFHGDKGIDGKNLGRVLYYTCLHESGGGKFDEQINGPARGIYQVEPLSAKSIVDNSSWVYGQKCTLLTNTTVGTLRKFNVDQMGLWLKTQINCAVIAGAIYVVMAYVKHKIDYLK